MISKLVDAGNQMNTWSFMNIKGQGHSLTFVQGCSDSTFSNFFLLETPRLIEARFRVEPPLDGGMKVNTVGLCHMTRMAAMSVYGKSSLEPKDWWPWNLVCGIGYSNFVVLIVLFFIDHYCVGGI